MADTNPDRQPLTDDDRKKLESEYADYLRERSKPWRYVGAYEEMKRQIASILESDTTMRGKLTQIKAAVGANDRTIAKMKEKEGKAQ